MKKLHVLFFIFLSICLFLGDGKQTVIDVFGTGAVICLFVVARLFYIKQRELPTPAHVWWSVVLVYFIIRSIFSDDIGYSVYQTARTLDAYVVFYIFYCYGTKELMHKFSRWIIGFSFFSLAASVIFSSIPAFSYFLPLMNLLTPTYSHNHIVDILLFSLPILLFYAIKNRKYYILVALILFGTVFSFARAAITFALGSLLVAFFVYRKRLTVKQRIFVGVCVFLFSFFAISAVGMPNHQKARITKYIPVVARADKGALFTNIRLGYWQQAIEAIQERPLFGSGPGTFFLQSKRLQHSPSSYSWFAHNIVLEWLVDIGIVGVILIFGLFIWIFHHIDKNNPLFYCVILILGYALIDYALNYLVLWFMLWSILGVLAGVKSKRIERPLITYNPSILFVGLLCFFYGISVLGYLGLGSISLVSESGAISSIEHNTKFSASAALMFHRKNADVLWALAKTYKKTHAQLALDYMRQAAYLDPHNAIYYKDYFRQLAMANQAETLGHEILLLSKTALPEKYHKQIDELIPYSVMLGDYYIHWMDKENSSFRHGYASMFYRFGISDLRDVEPMEKLLKLARDIYPDLGHFHVELASYYFHILGDKEKYEQVLQSCQAIVSAAQQCRDQMGNPPYYPGEYKDLIW